MWLKPEAAGTAASANFSHKSSRRFGVAGLLSAALVACAWLLAGGAASTASAQGDPCPNADIREQQNAGHLPDCRAYEQVSPVDKNGANAGLTRPDVASTPIYASADGNSVWFASNGTFSNPSYGGLFNDYVSRRGADGWETEQISPPTIAGTGTNASLVFWTTPDLTRQYVYSKVALADGAVSNTNNYYIQDLETGEYETVFSWSPLTGSQTRPSWGPNPEGTRWYFVSVGDQVPNAVPPAPGTQRQAFLYETGEGVKPIGILPDGTISPQGSTIANATGGNYGNPAVAYAVSEDATQAFWQRGAPSSQESELYLYREGQPSTLVTERESDGTAQGGIFWRATPDGASAFLSSNAQLTTDANPSGRDLYLYDRDTDSLSNLTPDSVTVGTTAGVEKVIGVSEDGAYAYFEATGALTADATEGEHNLYVWHNGEIRLIETSSVGLPAIAGNGSFDEWRVSPNGQYAAFQLAGAVSGPHPQPAPAHPQIYLYDFAADELTCASCPPEGGGTATGPAAFRIESSQVGNPWISGAGRNLADDGTLYFQSPDGLVNGDSNGVTDAYQHVGGTTSLISTGRSPEPSYFTEVGPGGDGVFILTTSKLVTQDKDSLYDVYTARVNGGFESQNQVPEPECQGDECQGEPSGSPEDDEPATGGTGAGNPDAEASCDPQSASVNRYGNRIQKLKSKKKQARQKAKSSSGKKAKRARKKAKRIGKKIRKVRGKKRDAKRDLRSCREAS